ncbi:ATP-binding protein [Desulfobacterales bacterium HSG2]|nr:ATP-binding protein [Desulfobacterales bacterium HSG2]
MRQQKVLKAIIDNIPIFLTRYDPEANMLYLNKEFEKKIGWKTEEVKDVDLMEKVYPDPVCRRQALEYMQKASVEWKEFRVQSRTGKSIVSEWSNIRLKDGTQISIGIDITRRKQDEEKLKQYSEHLEKMVDERTKALREAQKKLLLKERLAILGHFAGSISHEIRNPLAAIDSSVYFLKMGMGEGNEKVRKHLGRITSNVHKATSIIESLLNLTRMEKPKAEIHDLSELVNDALQSSKIPDTVEVVTSFSESISINSEREQIRMALKNIIKNAVQAMDGSGKLMITACIVKTGNAELVLTDTGPGIPSENLNKIFEPLFTTKAQGIGFGLSITKMIIENHGGTIRAESEPGDRLLLTCP